MRTRDLLATAMLLSMGTVGCADLSGSDAQDDNQEQLGTATLSLTKAPADAQCLRVSVQGSARSLTKLLPLTNGQSSIFRLEGLPVGLTSFTGEAFNAPCAGVFTNSVRSWYSEPVQAQVKVSPAVHVVLEMIRNGRAEVAVDFNDTNGPKSDPAAAELPGVTSSQTPYLVPVAAGVQIKALLTVGDAVGLKPDGVTPYRMVGIPDGLGAFENGDGTFTLLSNHEISTGGIVRAHGGTGAFVSKWRIRQSDKAVLSGSDVIQTVMLWDSTLNAHVASATPVNFARFCSADLPLTSAFYDAVSGLGTEQRFFLNGEESGAEGKPMAHGLDGVSYEIARLGNASWENLLANPATGIRTVIAGTDDGDGGQVVFYVGDKTNTGTPADKAGLTNGLLYAVAVPGIDAESDATGIAANRFEMVELGDVSGMTGAQVEAAHDALHSMNFQRPEDGAWDPVNPNDFYFNTTASFTGHSRLWRLRFDDVNSPELGGKIEMLLDGTEGFKMLDNLTIDRRGHVLLVEDVGNNAYIGRVLRYDIATDTLTVLAQHDPNRFVTGAAGFLTQDEEASGIVDASDVLGEGWFLVDTQAHYGTDAELVEGGQFMAIYDPGSL
ncbi:MAG: hypothetical protein QM778_27610 [Myxococcales bacterium]